MKFTISVTTAWLSLLLVDFSVGSESETLGSLQLEVGDESDAQFVIPPHRRLASIAEDASDITPHSVAMFKVHNQLKADADPIVQKVAPGGSILVALTMFC